MVSRPLPSPHRPVVPEVWLLPEATEVFSVHPIEVSGRRVEPGSYPERDRQRSSRFGPLPSGPTVLHVGTTASAALIETLLHDVPAGGRLLPEQYAGHAVSTLRTSRDVRVAVLTGSWLADAGIEADDLTMAGPAADASTQEWAEAVYADTDVDGMLWTTRAGSHDRALALFDRAGGALSFAGNSAALASPGGFEWLAGVCQRLSVQVLPAT